MTFVHRRAFQTSDAMKLAGRTASGYDRHDFELYETEDWVSRGAAKVLPLRGTVWEPAAGRGAIVSVLAEHGYPVWATDIHNHDFEGLNGVADFLTTPLLAASTTIRTIMTNPPYGPRGKLAVAFARHALAHMMPLGGAVAMLLRADFDSGSTRRDLFQDNPCFAGKLTLTSRPHWVSARKATPRVNYAWYWWDAGHVGLPVIAYLDKPARPRRRVPVSLAA